MKILVVGDVYVPVEVFREAFLPVAGDHEIDYLQLDMDDDRIGDSESERRIREFAGSPAQVIAGLGDHEVLVDPRRRRDRCGAGRLAQPAAGVLRPRRPGERGRGGSRRARDPGGDHSGKERRIGRRPHHRVCGDAGPGAVTAANYLANGGRFGESTYEGARMDR